MSTQNGKPDEAHLFQAALQVVIVLVMIAALAPAAIADKKEEKREAAAAGADASNPTAVVNYQDLRYRYFDIDPGAEKMSFDTEGAYMPHPRFKVTNELRLVYTDKTGSWSTDFEVLKLQGLFLTDGQPFGIKAKYALGLEWLMDLGNLEDGTGSGSDQIAPLAGIGWMPTESDSIVTLVQYFYSYDTHDGGSKVRKTGPRLIYVRTLPAIVGWFKADYKGEIDHQDDEDYSSTLELQLGTMFTERLGAYIEGFLGDTVFSSDQYNYSMGLGIRYTY